MPLPDANSLLRLLFPGAAPDPKVAKVTIGSPRIASKLTLSITDPSVDMGDMADEWTTTARPGQKPLLQRSGGRLATREIKAILDANYGIDVETMLAFARTLCSLPVVTVAYSTLEAGLWTITAFKAKTLRRGPGHNRVTQAEITIGLTEPSGPTLPAALKPVVAATIAPPPSAPAAAAPAPRRYTVKSGDTLWGIAVATYGDGTKWTVIAAANGITDPRRLRVGQVLTLP